MSPIFLTELPSRPESILRAVGYASNNEESSLQLACSSMEAPSAVVSALRLSPGLQVTFNKTPEPDPRIPYESVRLALWHYDEQVASPGLPRPQPQLLEAISRVIANEFDLDEWTAKATDTARTFAELTPSGILATMLYPIACPDDVWPWDWMFRSQVFTALVLAQHDEQHGVSPTASYLVDVVHGPVDWTTTAALVALAVRARSDVNHSTEVIHLFDGLLNRPVTPIWYMCACKPIQQLLSHVNCLDAEAAAIVAARLDELEDEDEDEDTSASRA